MSELMQFLSGKKTYLLAAIAAVLFFMQAVGVCEVPAEVWGFLGVGGAATLRAGIKKAE